MKVHSRVYSICEGDSGYSIVIPGNCRKFLNEKEIDCISNATLRSDVFVPYVYRFFNDERHVKDFFEDGSLLISNIDRCRALDEKNRKDVYESRNYFVISNNEFEICADVAPGIDNLLFCTSLSRRNFNENHEEYQYGFRINDVQGFLKELTYALVKCGVDVKCVWHGPCIYDNKIIINRNSEKISVLINSLVNKQKFDVDLLCETILEEGGDQIFFSKPVEYDIDNEYRFVWAIGNSAKTLNDSRVKVLDDGALILKAPELIKYCEQL